MDKLVIKDSYTNIELTLEKEQFGISLYFNPFRAKAILKNMNFVLESDWVENLLESLKSGNLVSFREVTRDNSKLLIFYQKREDKRYRNQDFYVLNLLDNRQTFIMEISYQLRDILISFLQEWLAEDEERILDYKDEKLLDYENNKKYQNQQRINRNEKLKSNH